MIVTPLAMAGLLGVSFVAGFVDSIAGGGGLLMVPSLMLSGLSPHWVLGTNKLNSTLGTSIAVWNFYRNGKILAPLVGAGIAFTLFGGWVGARLALSLDSAVLAKVLIFMLPIGMAAVFLRKKGSGPSPAFSLKTHWWKIVLICLSLGIYDGFFGPGAGSFLALLFYGLLHLGLVESTANAKVFNLVSNLGALIGFMIGGKVLYTLGIPLATMGMAGNYIGSRMAIRSGDSLIKKCLFGVLLLLLATLILKHWL